MPMSERLRSRWGPSRLAHHGDLRSSQWSKPQELHRPPFEWKKYELALISFPMRWVEGLISHCSRVSRRYHPERSLCSGEFGCRSFTKHSTELFVFYLSCENLACFYEPQFGRVSLKISLSDSVLETKRLQAEVLIRPAGLQVFKLLQNVNFDGFFTLTVWHFWQL